MSCLKKKKKDVGTVLEAQASTESNSKCCNILVVKGTADTSLREIRANATMITIPQLWCSLKEFLKEEERWTILWFSYFLAVSLAMFLPLGGLYLVEKHQNIAAKCPERLRTQVLASFEGFHMNTHYGRVGASYRVYQLSDTNITTWMFMVTGL